MCLLVVLVYLSGENSSDFILKQANEGLLVAYIW